MDGDADANDVGDAEDDGEDEADAEADGAIDGVTVAVAVVVGAGEGRSPATLERDTSVQTPSNTMSVAAKTTAARPI
jgi:hypothetical protein